MAVKRKIRCDTVVAGLKDLHTVKGDLPPRPLPIGSTFHREGFQVLAAFL
jgi:hypothetical protein